MSKFQRRLVTAIDDVSPEYVLNMNDVGAILDIHPSTASDWCARGIIRGAFQAGRFWRITAADLKKDRDRKKLPLNEQIQSIRDAARPRRRAS
jgi:hypothetical protein